MNMDMDERIGSAAVDEGNSMETFHSNAVTSIGNTDPQFLMDGWPDISSSRSDVNFVQHRDLSLSGINNGANSEMQLKEDVYTSLTTQVKEEFPLSTSVYNSAIVEPGEIVLGEGSTYHSSFDPELLAKVDTDPETGKKTKSYPCTMCDKSFPYVSRLIRHVKSHTGEKSFQCTICPKAFTTRSSQERHLKIHSGERPFACPMCDKTYARRCVLEDHIRTHTGEKPYVCSVCGRAFASSSHLPEHMRTHTREKPFECPVCKKAFAGSSNLQKHIKIHNGITREEYLAQLQSNLDNAGAKRFECSVCGSTFSKRFNLQVHIRLHTGERPYECSFCGKGFTSSTELQVHIRKHTGERPYKCTLCENTYSRRSYLNIHMRSHSGERPFECSECGKTFTTTSNLQVHMKTHMGKVEKVNNHTVPKMLYSPQVEEQTEINTKYEDGESELLKPFGCAICGSVFSEELGLQEHVKTHTEES